MIQTSLIDYISSQFAVGIGREAIKASLIGAGWQSVDVEDTLAKVEATAAAAAHPGGPSPAAAPGSVPGSAAPMSKMAAVFPATGAGPSPAGQKADDPRMIRMNDLISGNGPAPMSGATSFPASAGMAAAKSPAGSGAAGPASSGTAKMATAEKRGYSAAADAGSAGAVKIKSGHGLTWGIIVAILVLGAAGAAGFFYWQNSGLLGQVDSLNAKSAAVTAQLAALEQQAAASTTALAADEASLTAANQELALELSFYAVPPDAPSSTTASLSGALSGGGKALYAITTSYGAKIFIANSKDALVSAKLAPLVGTSIEVSGPYIPGLDNITVTDVAGAPITAPASSTTTASAVSSTTAGQ